MDIRLVENFRLTSGTRLGPYEILAALGAGGMGEVYRARDTRLDRTVAIKVLPVELARDPTRRQRFEREARAIASLTHPHICTLYEFDTEDQVDFLVMEYLEGETLEERLLRGPLLLAEALRLAIQIADALAAAHKIGIVHRDLKPGNIMLTGAGSGAGRGGTAQVKLLDFGLAKLRVPATGHALTSAPTASKPLTGEGTILGTLQYMAPEQLEGKEADARTDLFAFGAIVFEMVTGRKAFEGSSQASLIAAILEHDPPPLTEREPLAPPALERIVRKCLAKDPEERWHHAHDLAEELRWIAEDSATGRIPAVAAPRRPATWKVVAAMAAVALVTGAALWLTLRGPIQAPATLTYFVMPIEPGQELVGRPSVPLAISPDGSQVIYAAHAVGEARSSGRSQLYVRDLNAFSARAIPGTEGAESPFFSADGRWIGFHAQGALFRFLLGGTAPQRICSASYALLGASWAADDTIVFGTPGEGLRRVPASGGVPEVLTIPRRDLGEISHGFPQVLPDGEHLLFTISTVGGSGANRVGQISLATVEWGRLDALGPAGQVHYLPTGHLVFVQRGSLFAVRFDPERLETRGVPTPILEGLMSASWSGFDVASFAVSDAGTLVYVPAADGTTGESELVWVSRDGGAASVPAGRAVYRHPRLSPDATKVAVTEVSSAGLSRIWVHDLRGRTRTLLTPEWVNIWPVWTPDGSRVVYASTRPGSAGMDLYWRRADGSGPEETLLNAEGDHYPFSWTPDGGELGILTTREGPGSVQILTMGGEREPRTLVTVGVGGGFPRFSPDGRWLAYSSTESGRSEVYVRPYPDTGRRWIISTDGGTAPVWSTDGTELFYMDGIRMMSAEIDTTSTFSHGVPRTLFDGAFEDNPYGGQNYDVAPDGRFLMVRKAAGTAPMQLNVILDWMEELKKRVPNP